MAILDMGAPLSIADGVRVFGAATPDAVAVIDGDRSLTYRALADRARRLAGALLGAGLRPGERVGVLLGNRLEYVEVAAGLAMAGMPMVPVNPRSTGDEVDYVLGHSSARALVLDADHAAQAAGAVAGHGIRTVLEISGSQLGRDYERALEQAPSTDPRVPTDEREPFVVAYTSGTTGRPKGVMISHRSRCLTFLCTALEWGLGPGRRTVAVAPVYHGAGFAFAYGAVHTGGAVSMLRAFDPERLLTIIAADRAQTVFLVPTHAQLLRQLGDRTIGRHDLSSLETLYFNAAPFPFELKRWVLERFPGVGLHEVYGSTEAGVVTDLRPADQLRKPGSVGPAWFMTELRLLAPDGGLAGPGQPGELFSRSPFLMNGYLDDPAATSACTTEDGYLSSGDVAVMDEDGYVSIVDRVKDMILTGGSNVYPREVERVLAAHPSVADVAVIGLPHETWGEQVTAVVVPAPCAQVEPEELERHCRASLAGYKLPRRWETVVSLPRNAAGKVLKRSLREQLGSPV